MLEIDRRLGAHVFDAASGGALLWQHLFWFFGHPEVYILAIPFFGIATEIIPVFSRKPLFGYKTLIAATIAIAAGSHAVSSRPFPRSWVRSATASPSRDYPLSDPCVPHSSGQAGWTGG